MFNLNLYSKVRWESGVLVNTTKRKIEDGFRNDSIAYLHFFFERQTGFFLLQVIIQKSPIKCENTRCRRIRTRQIPTCQIQLTARTNSSNHNSQNGWTHRNMPRRIKKGKHALRGLVGSGEVSNKCLFINWGGGLVGKGEVKHGPQCWEGGIWRVSQFYEFVHSTISEFGFRDFT